MKMPGLTRSSLLCATVLVHLCVAAVDPHIMEEAQSLADWLTETRHELHASPELLYDLRNTSTIVRRHLSEMGVSYKYPIAEEGIVAEIGQGPNVVLLRADMDALPIHEETGLPYASRTAHRMHACGHDAHTTMLLGAARILKERASLLPGRVRLVFQPAEEGGAGGARMVAAGAAEGALAAFGLHVWPTIRSGRVETRTGTMLAGAITWRATVTGKGGHAAIPDVTVDPVVAAAAAVGLLQTLVSRETSPLEGAALSVTEFVAGDGHEQAHNIIPDRVVFAGVLRANSDAHVQRLKTRLREVLEAHAATYRCQIDVDFQEKDHPYYPPTVNHPSTTALAMDVATGLLGKDNVGTHPGTMAAEDFAFFANEVPATFIFLGTRNEALGSVHGLHTSRFLVDDAVLPTGAALHASLAIELLAREQEKGQRAKDEL